MPEKHKLQELLESAEVGFRSYSGRGMGGKECLGVTIRSPHGLGEFISDVIQGLEFLGEETSDVADAFRTMVTDSMGLGMIVYFPDVPFVEE